MKVIPSFIVLFLVLTATAVQAIDIPLFGKTRKAVINGQVVRVKRATIILKVSPEIRLSTFNTPWGRRQFDRLSETFNMDFLRPGRVFAPPTYLRIKSASLPSPNIYRNETGLLISSSPSLVTL
ncbi:hypothetical protein [Siphonobacter sp. SORGH_AS_0500]|uniref:hypothetical protein n=1 Tax=Siphonobacter sp. SORGH_AS_0500 TaxID=1864824 RepID=UPI000CB56CCA|nr:hypothetical protein [Siphonobacter sp. SORGH_AS_0500]MDR6193164.1 hypothetical protein [Siphonobacter sp. SORGH_AS_0500]PKK36640.1 hypothetical protein BWI96_09630 [Siphonobacter sp. SORGH_AS_0500]